MVRWTFGIASVNPARNLRVQKTVSASEILGLQLHNEPVALLIKQRLGGSTVADFGLMPALVLLIFPAAP